jgi:hypothetical protein
MVLFIMTAIKIYLFSYRQKYFLLKLMDVEPTSKKGQLHLICYPALCQPPLKKKEIKILPGVYIPCKT